eukprot:TRINITY_DN221_c0_g1_i9.p1 TRINITY_DN221_c0_g1~~TRINITY_DN221_c0_g1_i9.p1  ORF type:complete len:148 (-),score=31.49 TRINITY_DN221_c0_g1_i9:88-531(-)
MRYVVFCRGESSFCAAEFLWRSFCGVEFLRSKNNRVVRVDRVAVLDSFSGGGFYMTIITTECVLRRVVFVVEQILANSSAVDLKAEEMSRILWQAELFFCKEQVVQKKSFCAGEKFLKMRKQRVKIGQSFRKKDFDEKMLEESIWQE